MGSVEDVFFLRGSVSNDYCAPFEGVYIELITQKCTIRTSGLAKPWNKVAIASAPLSSLEVQVGQILYGGPVDVEVNNVFV